MRGYVTLRHNPALLLIGNIVALPENYIAALEFMMYEKSKEYKTLDIEELFEDYYLTDEDLDIIHDLILNATVTIKFN